MNAVADILIPEFDEATHTYSLGPSVTQILDPLKDSSHYTMEKREFGKAVHAAIHYYNENDLDWDTLGEAFKPRVEGWARFCQDTGFTPDLIEQPMASRHGYCGKPDAVDLDLALADIKTGAPEPWHAIQTALYCSMLPNPYINRWGVYLNERGTYTLKQFPKTDYHSDLNVGLNCLAIHNWKARHL